MAAEELVVLVHGLWMSGLEFTALKSRLESDHGLPAAPFSYPSVSGRMVDHIKALREFAQGAARSRGASCLHFVGHSLGGLVVLRLLESTADLPPGRAVLLGPPLQGSLAAQGLARWPLGRAILGQSIREEMLLDAARLWDGRREVGVIAGSSGFGLGRLFAKFEDDHDGTVLVRETRLEGVTDHLVLPVTHTSMLFSAEVAAQTATFLREGHFRSSAPAP